MRDLARGWHLLTVVVTAGAVLLQLVLVVTGSAVLAETDPPSLGARLGRFVCYFTIQANVLVAVSTAQLARNATYDGGRWRVVRGAAVVGITITGLVHFVLLRPLLELDGLDRLADPLLHLVVPALAVLGWLAFGPRPRTGRRELSLALVWPVGWLGLILVVRGASGRVPYPFLDPDGDGGWTAVAVACVGITLLFALTCTAVYAVDRRLSPVPPVSGRGTPAARG